MAGDWIKLETTTPDKPEVVQIAAALGIDQDAVVGKLVRVWIWADANSVTGHDICVTDIFIDRLTHRPGFAVALRGVGWLSGRDGRLAIPNFDRHNGQSAKSRALAKDRQRMSRNERDKTVTKTSLEKRREEKKNISPLPPAREEVVAFAASQKGWEESVVLHWFNERESQGWIKGNGHSVANWRADLEAWVIREARGNAPQSFRYGNSRNAKTEAQRDADKTGFNSKLEIRKL